MVASVVSVRAGSVYETESICGVSHLLEHLLFNGTVNRTQEQLYAELDFYGIYNNAHTSVEFTNYIVMSEPGHIEKALDIQADMLFRSSFPKGKLEKEKGIVLNEMAKDHSNPDTYIDELFTRKFFLGTPYNLPVIGTPRSIRRIHREEIIRYYRNHYSPDNMTIMLAGDFKTPDMLEKVKKYFGAVPPSGISKTRKRYQVNPDVAGQTHVSRMKVQTGYLALGIPLPPLEDSVLRSLDRFLRIADRDFTVTLNEALAEKGMNSVFSSGVGLNRSTRIPLVEVQARFSGDMDWEPITETMAEILSRLPEKKIEAEDLRRLKVRDAVEERRLWEKPHYYGMIRGGEFSYRGIDAVTEDRRPTDFSEKGFRKVLTAIFSTPRFMSAVVLPGEDTPDAQGDRIQGEYFSDPDYWSRLGTDLPETSSPPVEPRGKEGQSPPESASGLFFPSRNYKKTALKNGLVVIVDSNPGSKLFAVHLLAKNRSAMEPGGKEGIADLLHRMIGKGTQGKSMSDFQHELERMGATVKTRDDDSIPFDDHSTTSEYSYVRFETLDDFSETGFRLFAEMIRDPRFDPNDFAKEKQELLNLIRKRKESPKWISQNLFFPHIGLGPLYRKGVYGTEGSVESIRLEDLQVFHHTYFSPSNLILSIGTSKPLEEMTDFVMKIVGSWTPVSVSPPPPVPVDPFRPGQKITTSLGLSQSYVRMGYPVNAEPNDLPLLQLTGALFSGQIRDDLVESKGWAYSFDAGFGRLFDQSYFYTTIGTRPETVQKVENELMDLVERFRTAEPTRKDLDRIRNRLRFSLLMRSLARVDQMYLLGLYEFAFQNPDHGADVFSALRAVTPEQVQTTLRTHFSKKRISTVVVE
jgi:predicted Zn-dependent peptidase